MWDVELRYVRSWLLALDAADYDLVMASIELLRDRGPHLGRPVVDSVVTSRHGNLKELRPGSSGRSELRILFAFDPKRMAILLVAGDKSKTWQRWYRQNVPRADQIFDEHLARSRNNDKD